MKIENYEFPKSSFLSLQKDAQLIISKMLKNENLKKLLFYADRNCLSLPNLDQKDSIGLIESQIKLVPKIYADSDLLSYIILRFDSFVPNQKNPEFRDNIIGFDIICHLDQWNLGDFRLRPYCIAGEIDAMFNNTHLTGIGELEFLGANQVILNDELSGVSLSYRAIHGEEDRVK